MSCVYPGLPRQYGRSASEKVLGASYELRLGAASISCCEMEARKTKMLLLSIIDCLQEIVLEKCFKTERKHFVAELCGCGRRRFARGWIRLRDVLHSCSGKPKSPVSILDLRKLTYWLRCRKYS